MPEGGSPGCSSRLRAVWCRERTVLACPNGAFAGGPSNHTISLTPGTWNKPRITCNARMGSRELKQYCPLDEPTLEMLKFAMAGPNFSARAYDRILKGARTIADLAGAENILSDHISEAVQYRSLDRQLWT